MAERGWEALACHLTCILWFSWSHWFVWEKGARGEMTTMQRQNALLSCLNSTLIFCYLVQISALEHFFVWLIWSCLMGGRSHTPCESRSLHWLVTYWPYNGKERSQAAIPSPPSLHINIHSSFLVISGKTWPLSSVTIASLFDIYRTFAY